MRLLPSLLAASLCVGGFVYSHEAAADEPRCHIVLYGKRDFAPGSSGFRILFTDEPNLERHDFDNKVSSFVIVKGRWRFYTRNAYEGERNKRLEPGLYPNVESVGIPNNRVSSLKCRDD